MIINLAIKNFRSLRDVNFELRHRNVLIGPNKSGKTSLIDALRFLGQAITLGDVSGPLNERGGMANIVWKGTPLTLVQPPPLYPIEFQLDGEVQQNGRPARFSYYLSISADLRGQIAIKRETLDATIEHSKRRLIDVSDGEGIAKRWDGSQLFANPGDLKKPALAYDVPGWEAGIIKAEIVRWHFFDLIPQLAKATSNTSAAVTALDVHGANLSSWIHTLQTNYPEDFNRIAKIVRDAFPEIESLGTVVTQAGTTFLTSREKFLQAPTTLFEASAGELKFLALLSLIYSPFGVPLICIEEPENHLHPRLLSLLVEMANHRRTELEGRVSQAIVTTHSPYLVDLLEPEDIVLVSKQSGETRLRRPESGDELRRLMRESEQTLGRLWFSGSLGDAQDVLYGVIAEDTYILKSVPMLVSRLVNLEGEPVECRRMNGKPDFIANFWRAAKEFQFKYPRIHKVLAVCDADAECPQSLTAELRDRAGAHLAGLPFPLIFHVIKRELETWWVAESTGISVVTGVPIPFPGGNVEQGVADPKEYIVRRLATARKVYTPADAEAIAARVDLQVLTSRCPGFVTFTQKAADGQA